MVDETLVRIVLTLALLSGGVCVISIFHLDNEVVQKIFAVAMPIVFISMISIMLFMIWVT